MARTIDRQPLPPADPEGGGAATSGPRVADPPRSGRRGGARPGCTESTRNAHPRGGVPGSPAPRATAIMNRQADATDAVNGLLARVVALEQRLAGLNRGAPTRAALWNRVADLAAGAPSATLPPRHVLQHTTTGLYLFELTPSPA